RYTYFRHSMRPWPLLLPLLTIAATAQTSPSARHRTGTVTGHVYCVDTNTPARLASVQLAPVKKAETRSGTSVEVTGIPAGGVAQTGFDGSFTLTRVPPGSY